VTASQPAQATLATAETARQDSLLAKFARSISSDLALHELLRSALDCVAQMAQARMATIGIHGAQINAQSAGWSSVVEHRFSDSRSVAGAAELLLDAVAVGDLPRFDSYQSQPVLALSVRAGESQRGVLVLVLSSPSSVPTDLLDCLQAVADHMGMAIRNAARITRERRRTARFELVSKVARIINRSGSPLMSTLQLAADAIHEVLEYPNVDIPLLDPDNPDVLVIGTRGGDYKQQIAQVDRVPIERGIMGAVARNRRTILANDVQRDHRYVRPPVPNPSKAELAVPLLSGDALLGVLNVEGDGPFDELDQLTIEAIAQHLALAIDNAALVSEQQTNAIQEERQRLAFELHDSVTQALSGISMLAQGLPAAWDKGREDGLRAAQRVAELARVAVGEMRTLLHELSAAERQNLIQRTTGRGYAPVGLELLTDGGLGAALPKFLGVLVPPHIHVNCDFSAYVTQAIEHEQALYRVFQEAASNLVRHSGANSLQLTALVDARFAQVCIRDNGRGCSSAEPDGFGFRSMRQRMEKLGGALRLRSVEPQGFEVLATLKRLDRKPTA